MSYQLADPNSVLTFTHDWSTWLESSGSPSDTIESRQWSITPEHDGSPTTPTLTNAAGATVTVAGLEAGKVYRLTERITTAAGLTEDRTIILRCDDT